MKTLAAIAVSALALSGCPSDTWRAECYARHAHFEKEAGICFRREWGYDEWSTVVVPCTTEVEAKIVRYNLVCK